MSILKAKKPALKVLYILSAVLLVASLILSVYMFTRPFSSDISETVTVVCSAIGLVAVISGLIYVLGGYKKNDSFFYKLFMLLVCLESVSALFKDIIITQLIITQEMVNIYSISGILRAFICTNLAILVLSKDLGKKTSIGLAGAVLGITVIEQARLLLLYFNLPYLISAVVSFSLALLVLLLVIGKYMDKAERGTK